MIDRLKIMDARYEELNKLLSDPEVVCDIKKLTEYSKEQRQLEKAVVLYREYTKLQDAIPDLKEMKASDDAEIAEMAAMELEESVSRIAEIEEEVKILLLPKDPNDDKNVIVEIRGGAGGEEASLFAYELYRMYVKYAERNRWKTEEIENNPLIDSKAVKGLKEYASYLEKTYSISCQTFQVDAGNSVFIDKGADLPRRFLINAGGNLLIAHFCILGLLTNPLGIQIQNLTKLLSDGLDVGF